MSFGERLSRRVLAIYPTSRGFGFVIFEGPKTLLDWGLPQIPPREEATILRRIDTLLERYNPDLLVIESITDPKCRRKRRVRKLLRAVGKLAAQRRVPVEAFSKDAVRRVFAHVGAVTKQQIASFVASQYRELAPRLPPQRKTWQSEDVRISLFCAAALAIAFYLDVG